MYQSPYRYPRKKRTPWGAKLLAILIALAVLVGGIRYLSSLGSKIEEQVVNTTKTGSALWGDWYIGKDISIAGTLSWSTDPLAYSHTLITTGWDIVRLGSTTINLNNYEWFVYVKWSVTKVDQRNDQFTIDVKAIGNTEWDLQSSSFAPSADTKFFSSIALKVDTSLSNDITYTNTDNKIIFSTENISGTVEVEWFKCETWFPEKDCGALAKQYTTSTFVNRAWLSISKDPNGTGSWFAQNSAGAGYKITAWSDALLYKISSVLVPVDQIYIKWLIPSIAKLCTPWANMETPTITKEAIDTWLVKTPSCTARVVISNTDGEKVTIVSSSESPSSATGSTTTTTTTNSNPNNTNTTAATNNTSAAPRATTSGYDFTSTRGNYTINFPSASISYNGVNVTEDLGVKWLSCYVNIGVKSYADRENSDIGSAVEIYECTSKLSSSSIQVPDTIMKTSADGTKLFFIKTLNPNRSDFAKGIEIK